MADAIDIIDIKEEAEPIGSGATAVVYEEQYQGKTVAVKVLREEAVGNKDLERLFNDEYKILEKAAKQWKEGAFFLWKGEEAESFLKEAGFKQEEKRKVSCWWVKDKVASAPLPFPEVFPVQRAKIKGNERPALVMEWISEGSSVVSVLRWFDQQREKIEKEIKEIEKEELAGDITEERKRKRKSLLAKLEKHLFKFACQIGQVVLLMKQMGKYNPDMKWDDIFLILGNKQDDGWQRLVLLDWNGLKPLASESKEHAGDTEVLFTWPMIQDGIRRTLASLLYRLATGKVIAYNDIALGEKGIWKKSVPLSDAFKKWIGEGLSAKREPSLEDWLAKGWIGWMLLERVLLGVHLVKLEKSDSQAQQFPLSWLSWAQDYLWKGKGATLYLDWEYLWNAWLETKSTHTEERLSLWQRMVRDYSKGLWEEKQGETAIRQIVEMVDNEHLKENLARVERVRKLWNEWRALDCLMGRMGEEIIEEIRAFSSEPWEKVIRAGLPEDNGGENVRDDEERFDIEKAIDNFLRRDFERIQGWADAVSKLLYSGGNLTKKQIVNIDRLLLPLLPKESLPLAAFIKQWWCQDLMKICDKEKMDNLLPLSREVSQWGVSWQDAEYMCQRWCTRQDIQIRKIMQEAGDENKAIPQIPNGQIYEVDHLVTLLKQTKWMIEQEPLSTTRP